MAPAKFLFRVPLLLLALLLCGIFLARPVSAEESAPRPVLSFEQRLTLSALLALAVVPVEKRPELLGSVLDYYQRRPLRRVVIQGWADFEKYWLGPRTGVDSVPRNLELILAAPPEPVFIFDYADAAFGAAAKEWIQREHGLITSSFKSTPMLPLDKLTELLRSRELGHILGEVFDREVDKVEEIFTKLTKTAVQNAKASGSAVVFQDLLGNYFRFLGTESKAQIILALASAPMDSSVLEKFEVLVQNTGPQFQKTLQVIGREAALPPELAVIFQKFEDAVAPVPYSELQRALRAEGLEGKFAWIDERPLGVGTMAQIHRVKLAPGVAPTLSRNAVVRFRKPRIALRVEEDRRVLLRVAELVDARIQGLPEFSFRFTPLVDQVSRTVEAELDFRRTSENQEDGRRAYAGKKFKTTVNGHTYELTFDVPLLVDLGQSSENFMALAEAPGGKVDRLLKLGADAAGVHRALVENMARIWFDALLGNLGFYHADLHPGNVLVDVENRSVRASILDFGMAGRITAVTRSRLVRLIAGITTREGDLIARALWDLRATDGPDTLTLETLRKKVAATLASGAKANLQDWIQFSINQGLRISFDLVNFARSYGVMEMMLKNGGSTESVLSVAGQTFKRKPWILSRIMSEAGFSKYAQLKIAGKSLVAGWARARAEGKSCRWLFKAK